MVKTISFILIAMLSFILILTGCNDDNAIKKADPTDDPIDDPTDDPVDPVGDGRVPDAGIYAIWLNNKTDHTLDLPYITGGQVTVQFGEVNPLKGEFNPKPIEDKLEEFRKRNMKATIQINGNEHADWMFEEIPYNTKKFHVQVQDDKGTLMYWYPGYRDAYTLLLSNFGEWLSTSEYKDNVLGIRFNTNAIGTELYAPQAGGDTGYYDLDYVDKEGNKWVIPEVVDKSSLVGYSSSVFHQYEEKILDAYVDHVSPNVFVFLRHSIETDLIANVESEIRTGKLGFFHTGFQVEIPRSGQVALYKSTFYSYCRPGLTVGYGEPTSDTFGNRQAGFDDRWCSPAKWNYWTILNSLHMGISYIPVRGEDLKIAIDGIYYDPKKTGEEIYENYKGQEQHYKSEYYSAFQFAAKYAGYHAAPTASPGAWIAFRENDVILAENGLSITARTLSDFKNDYTFLMSRVAGDKSVGDVPGDGLSEYNNVPGDVEWDWQRYGAWVRKLPSGDKMTLRLNEDFAESLEGEAHTLRIIYFDNNTSFTVGYQGTDYDVSTGSSGVWNVKDISIEDGSSLGETDITITPDIDALTLHMVEVTRD